MTRTLLRDGVDGTRRPLDVLVDNVSTTTIVAAGEDVPFVVELRDGGPGVMVRR
jgi:hypothetical protein